MGARDSHLIVPPAAVEDPASFEILRVWAAAGEQHVAIRTELLGGPEDWGFLLAQLARHMANAYTIQQRYDRSDALARIRQGFDSEWRDPSTAARGEIP